MEENQELHEDRNQNLTKIIELEKLVAIKNKYLEVRMINEDVDDPSSILSQNLAQKATIKIQELRRTIEKLMGNKDKDTKYYNLQVIGAQSEAKKMKREMDSLKRLIKEKDRMIMFQGLKLKEVLFADDQKRVLLLQNEFEELSKLANPDMHQRGIPSMTMGNEEKLGYARNLEHKYGKLNPLKASTLRSNKNSSISHVS